MSTEQQQPETPAADTTQQETSPTPTTRPAKNPKRVAAGKMVAERTWAAREAQKKAAAEAAIIIENNKAKPPQEVPAASSPATERNTISSHSLSTTQWLAAGSIVVSLVEFITNVKSSRPSTTKTLPHNMPHNMQKPAPAEPEPATVAQPKKGSLIKMN